MGALGSHAEARSIAQPSLVPLHPTHPQFISPASLCQAERSASKCEVVEIQSFVTAATNIKPERGFHERSKMYPRKGSSEKCEASHQGLRGVSQDRRHLGSSAHVPGVWKGRLLRLLPEPPRHGTLPRSRASHRAIHGTRGRLALVLHRPDLSITSDFYQFSAKPGRHLDSFLAR